MGNSLSLSKSKKFKRVSIAQLVSKALPKAKIELTDEQLRRLERMSEIVLGVAAVAGLALLAVVAPNVLQALDKIPFGKKTYRNFATKNREQRRKITRTFYYLKAHDYIQLLPSPEGLKVKVTEKGRKKILQMNLQTAQIPHQKLWNGHWWVVFADIPTKLYRSRADALRQKIKEMKFFCLQRTVWVYPFDPRDQIDFVSAYYGIHRFVTCMEACGIHPDDEKRLKNYFKKQKIL